jgi:hypothetical protein
MKSLYIVDYWIPFPSSEYGGLINVIAQTDEECHDILLEWRSEYNSKYDSKIMERVVAAPRYLLSENIESGIVESFTT